MKLQIDTNLLTIPEFDKLIELLKVSKKKTEAAKIIFEEKNGLDLENLKMGDIMDDDMKEILDKMENMMPFAQEKIDKDFKGIEKSYENMPDDAKKMLKEFGLEPETLKGMADKMKSRIQEKIKQKKLKNERHPAAEAIKEFNNETEFKEDMKGLDPNSIYMDRIEDIK